MGCYDTVRVPCPRCGERSDFQSKGGPCDLGVFDLECCPSDVLSDVNRHAPNTCEKCGTLFDVRIVAYGVPHHYQEENNEDEN